MEAEGETCIFFDNVQLSLTFRHLTSILALRLPLLLAVTSISTLLSTTLFCVMSILTTKLTAKQACRGQTTTWISLLGLW